MSAASPGPGAEQRFHGVGAAARPCAIRAAAVVAIAVAVVLLARVLPAGEALGRLSAWVEGLGAVAPVVFGLIYVLATVLLIPGSVLTLAAGAVFGLGLGLVVVSLASTAGAALCFLIARHVARARVARWLEHYPKVRAIDRAVGERGWKIVALLRLSPALPFNVQNYLYGLTAIGFWPCVLASWLAMLPGTLLYVYLGHAARQGLEVAAGAAAAPSTGRLVLTAVGLLATAAVTIYAAVIAYRAIREQADLAAAQGRPPRGELAAAAPAQGVPGGQPEQEVIMAGRGPAA
ncbi:MAG: hypothetical protein KatS3mg102_2682 [Planctomycetota bacterium]|nr:MAG: hypothetical protein KatS3mg102_2682 [Planctomycetota bacterium]